LGGWWADGYKYTLHVGYVRERGARSTKMGKIKYFNKNIK